MCVCGWVGVYFAMIVRVSSSGRLVGGGSIESLKLVDSGKHWSAEVDVEVEVRVGRTGSGCSESSTREGGWRRVVVVLVAAVKTTTTITEPGEEKADTSDAPHPFFGPSLSLVYSCQSSRQ